MKVAFFLAAIGFTATFTAQQPAYQWAKSFQSASGRGQGTDISLDQGGNVICVGTHSTGLNFDPASGSGGLKLSNGDDDAFVAKLDNSGNYIWAGTIGGPNLDQGSAVATDTQSNIYVCGNFYLSADLDPGTGTASVSSTGSDAFIVKLNSSGNFQWGKALLSTVNSNPYAIACDASGNVYITGGFHGTTDFDPGTSVYTVTSVGDADAFLLKLSSSGSFLWVKTFGGIYQDYGFDLAVDNNGDIYVTGEYANVVDFDPGSAVVSHTSTGNSSQDFYLVKYSPAGIFQWTSCFGSASDDFGLCVTTDPAGYVYTGTWYYGPMIVGTTTLTHSGVVDALFAKHNSSGNLVWLRTVNGQNRERPNDVFADASGNLYATGAFEGVVDFDPGSGTYTLAASAIDYDIYMMRLDSLGNFNWAFGIGNGGVGEIGTGIVVDQARSIYSTGVFYGTTDFDPGSGYAPINMVGSPNYFPYVNRFCQPPDRPGPMSGSTLACTGSTQQYSIQSVSTATSYSWSVPSLWSGTSTATTVSTSINAAGTISVTASNACGVSPTRTLSVQVSPIPVIQVNSGSVCPGGSFTISTSGASTYTIAGGSAVVSPTALTMYTVIGTSSAGCISTVAATSTVGLFPQPTVSATSGSICPGSSFTIVPSGASTYTITGGQFIVSPTTTTSYFVSGMDANGCEQDAVSSVTVNPQPTVSVNSGSICLGGSFTIVPSGASTYTIAGGQFIVSPITTSSYSVTGSDANGCTQNAISLVTVNPQPTLTVSSGSICFGGTFTIVPSGAITYTITGAQFIVSPTITTSYFVTGTDANGCTSQQYAISSVTVMALPPVSVSLLTQPFCKEEQVTVIATGATTFTWNTGANTPTITTVAGPIIEFTVTGTDGFGCMKTVTVSQAAQDCTGEQELTQAGELEIFPNPCVGLLNVRSLNDGVMKSLSIIDAVARVIYKIDVASSAITLDVSGLSNGIYILIAQSGGRISRYKIAVQ